MSDKTIDAMREHLEWNRHDVATISAMADLELERGNEEAAADLRRAAIVANQMRALAKEKRMCKERLKQIQKNAEMSRKQCPHPVTKYYLDASGNNDSWYECLRYGAEV